MSNIFKRLAAVVLVLTLFASLSACKKKDESKAQAEKVQNTVAVTVGEHSISAAELNYYFVDAVTEWYNQYGNYGHYLGFDAKKPLNEQVINSATGETWADSFITTALDNIRSNYALYDQAMAEGFTLTEGDQKALNATIEDLEALIDYYNKYYSDRGYSYPYSDAASYLEAVYGIGATTENYMDYFRVCTIAKAYYAHYHDSLEFTNVQLREFELDKYDQYSSFSFSVYYVPVSSYENAEAAKAVADQLAATTYADVDAFNEAIKALPINAGKEDPALAASYKEILYAKIESSYVKWLAQKDRVSGDMTVVANEVTSEETTTVSGYYVVRFEGVNINDFLLKNVRHLLIAFEGGTFNSTTGVTTYSPAEKKAAHDAAEKLWFQFRTGTMTELRFANLANEHSDDGDGTTGGLYENVYPGLMVEAFEQWCYDPMRKPGDCELVESEFGWHIMYFVGNTEYTFREHMLTNDLRLETLTKWFESTLEQYKTNLVNDEFVNKGMMLNK